METKTQKALCLLKSGNVKDALKIIRTFRIGFSKDERRVISIACECLCGSASFYTSIGVNCEKIVNDAIAIVNEKYQ